MKTPPPVDLPSAESLERVRALAERQLTVEEFNAYLNTPMSEDELQGILESVAWFTRRYPTAGERLAAARRAYERWTRSRAQTK